MKRRNFVQKAAMASTFAGIGVIFNNKSVIAKTSSSNSAVFKLKYAPSLDAFPELAGSKDPIDQIRFCNDQGFIAMYDNNLLKKAVPDQDKIMNELSRRKMDLGPAAIFGLEFKDPTMVLGDSEIREMVIKKISEGIEQCKRIGIKWATVIPGPFNMRTPWDYQTANVIDTLRQASDIAEKGGVILVLEPLNKNMHPGQFLTGIPQSYAICRAVNSTACKILDDMYHQQITEGDLISNIDAAWSEIASFHIGDNPGRKEPGTGEINYNNIFRHIYEKGYNGVLCMEHGKSIKGKEGELAMIEAYHKADNF